MSSFEEQMDAAHAQFVDGMGETVTWHPFDSADVPNARVIFVEAMGSVEDSDNGKKFVDTAVVSLQKNSGDTPIETVTEKDSVTLNKKLYKVQRIQKQTPGRAICRIVSVERQEISRPQFIGRRN